MLYLSALEGETAGAGPRGLRGPSASGLWFFPISVYTLASGGEIRNSHGLLENSPWVSTNAVAT